MRRKLAAYFAIIIFVSVVLFYVNTRQNTYFSDTQSIHNSSFFSWIPTGFPSSAKNIRIWTDVETNQMGMSFELSSDNKHEFEKYKISNVTQIGRHFFIQKQTVFKKLRSIFTQSQSEIYCYTTPDNELYLVEKPYIENNFMHYNLVYFSSRYWNNISEICHIDKLAINDKDK